MKITRLPHLSKSRSPDSPKTGPCVLSSLLVGYYQYYNPKRGATLPALLFPLKNFFVALFNLFDILFKTSTSVYSSKT
jgi:hypothetical protein